MPTRAIAPVGNEECLTYCANQDSIVLDDRTSTLLAPIVGCFLNNQSIARDLVSLLLTGMCEGQDAAWKATFLAGNNTVDQYLQEREQTLTPLQMQVVDGDVIYSPEAFAHILVQLGHEEGHRLQTLMGQPTSTARLQQAKADVLSRRLDVRNANADLYNANKKEIVAQGIADGMFGAREETHFYRGTIGSTDAALQEAGYDVATRRKIKRDGVRQVHSLGLGNNRHMNELIKNILLNNSKPGGPLANVSAEEKKDRLRTINQGSIQSWNAAHGTIAKSRRAAFVRLN